MTVYASRLIMQRAATAFESVSSPRERMGQMTKDMKSAIYQDHVQKAPGAQKDHHASPTLSMHPLSIAGPVRPSGAVL